MNSKNTSLVTVSIGEIAKRTGMNVSAIRYYEEIGLIQALRTKGANRRFTRSEIRKVSFIAVSQSLGFTLKEIGAELDKLPNDRAPNKADWTRISKTFRKKLDQRIEMIEKLRDRLDGCIGCGCLSMQSCALYNKNDVAADLGSGARFIIDDEETIAELDQG